MRLRHIILTFVLLLAHTGAYAGPARNTPVYLKQPDGSVFQARIRGDEFTRIKTDATGHAIIQEADGWWTYAIYKEDGTKGSTGWRVGGETPHEILSASMRIPHAGLSRAAQERRAAEYGKGEKPMFTRMKELHGISTRSGEDASPAIKHGLVILADFKDVQFKHQKEDFERLLTEKGYSVNGATGSVKEYFDAQFDGLMEFDFHVSDIVTLPKNRAYYGSNDDDGSDKAPAEMIADACRLADGEIDFSLYDDDMDGDVDNVFLFFAGQDEAEGASEECIWSHAWYIRSGAGINLELDGTAIDRYACSSEMTIAYDPEGNIHEFISGIGTFCHEYSHTLGLPDFYDTDYEESGGISAGLWITTALMDGGNYNNLGNTPPYYNALERIIAGISEPEVLQKTGTYTLEPVNVAGRSYILPTETEGVFYLFECRSDKGWDKYIGGSGMLAYRIDITEDNYDRWLSYNEVNTDPEHQHADLLEADGRPDGFPTMDDFVAYRRNISGIFFPYLDIDSIDLGNDMSIASVRKDGEDIRFNFLNNSTRTPPSVINLVKEVFADAAIIRFESSYPHDGEASVYWGRPGEEKELIQVTPYENGRYALILEGLEPAGMMVQRSFTLTVFIATR